MNSEQVKAVSDKTVKSEAQALLQEGMRLAKCRKCGCMKDALDNIAASLRSPRMDDFADLRQSVEIWLGQMQPTAYA